MPRLVGAGVRHSQFTKRIERRKEGNAGVEGIASGRW
jgi:hypothetical protein